MKISRKFTTPGSDPFASVKWTKRSSKITNPDGSTVFEMHDAEVPETWSQLATDIMVSKYFRKAGVPQGGGGGTGLQTSDGSAKGNERNTGQETGATATGPETSARQVIHRLAGCWRYWGEKHNYFDTPADAQAFYDELSYMMVHQMAAPNSPQWFNTGLAWAYGLTGPAQGHFVPDPVTGKVGEATDAYTHPQPHACFIQSVTDDLVNEGGIMDLWVREARLFKYGSGTGTNFSHLRAENESLSGGGKSSGLMSWLRIGDRAAGAIKSGGTTRRAAKMVCLDMDHPDIQKFINWKVREEIKVAAMVEGMKHLPEDLRADAKSLGLKLDYDFNGEAYATVSGQNSNNSVRIPDAFFECVDLGGEWKTYYRTSNKPAKTFSAKKLWDEVCYAAWRCADPGVQFDSTINAWHTCPSGGRINASNPCSEYMFLDNTACNLASINVLKFYDSKQRTFDCPAYEHAIDLWTVVLEISVLMASYPSSEVARLSYKYRTLGLGYANLGAMLMQAGIPYDSEESRALCACLTAILTGRSYRQSAVMAQQLGAFPGYADDRDNMLRVIRNHKRAAHGAARDSGQYEDMKIAPVPIDHAVVASGRISIANAPELLRRATISWDEALALGERYGYRNAQVSVIAPTGTIGLLMDCDTTGIEPDFALVKFKKLAGGGYFKIANASVKPALEALGYTAPQIRDILVYLLGTLSLEVPLPAPDGTVSTSGSNFLFKDWLLDKGLVEADLHTITDALPGIFEISFAFNAWTLGDAAMERLGLDAAATKTDPKFNLLRRLGLTRQQITALNDMICGTQTVEGARHLTPEHLPVFDCANTCGKYGKRFIHAHGHIRMMAAGQPFISGAISKTINLPNSATVDEIGASYRLSWELGLKANALYRDGCKLSQPLSSKSDAESDDEPTASEQEAEKKAGETTRATATPVAAATGLIEPTPHVVVTAAAVPPPPQEVRIVQRPMRRRLADTRASITHKFNIAGHEGYLTVGLYDDGMPGELFITMAKEGSTIGGLMDSLGTAVSVALQYGVPVQSLVNKFTHQRFEPAGMTANRDIPFAKSLVDYIFRWMGMEFIPGYREENAPRRGTPPQPIIADSDAAEDLPPPPPLAESAGGGGGGAQEDRLPAPWTNRLGSPTTGHDHAHAHRTPAEATTPAAHAPRAHHHPSRSGTGGNGSATLVGVVSTVTSLSMAMQNNMGDAPACDGCGAITVRSGTCYKCLNCGNSMGCS